MKTLMKTMIAGFALFTGTANAQTDTLIIKHDTVRTTIDTVKVIERTAPPQVVHDTVAVNNTKKDAPPLRWGEFGLRFMPTWTYLSFNTSNGDVVQGTSDINYGYGALLGFNFTKNIGVVGEIDYLGISQKYKDQGLERQVHINYLNIPVMLSINTDKTKPVNLNLVVGPQFGINVGSSLDANGNGDNSTMQGTLAVKSNDVGIAYGAGLEFALNRQHTIRFDLGFRGMYGLVDINSTTTGPNTYNVLVNASRRSYGGFAGFTFAW